MAVFDVVGLGQCSVDILGVVSPYPPLDVKAETQALELQGGGPVATALVAVSRLGLKTAFIGKVGDDLFGTLILQGLKKERVDVAGVVTAPGKTSQTAFIAVEKKSGKRTIFWNRGTAFPLTELEIPAETIAAARFLHLDGLHIQASMRAARIARENGIPTMLDTGTFRPEILDLMPLVDFPIVGEGFANALTGNKDLYEALEKLRKHGAKTAGITLGPRGAMGIDEGGEVFMQKAFPVEAADTTGCGDAFHGGLIFGILQGYPLRKVFRFAAATAALKCRKIGGRAALPTLPEVERFLGPGLPGLDR